MLWTELLLLQDLMLPSVTPHVPFSLLTAVPPSQHSPGTPGVKCKSSPAPTLPEGP